MGKRMIALFLAMVLVWNLGTETLFSMETQSSPAQEEQTVDDNAKNQEAEEQNPASSDIPKDSNTGSETVPPESEPEVAPPESEPEITPPESEPEIVPPESGPEVAPPESEPETVPPETGQPQEPEQAPVEIPASYTLIFDFNGGQTRDGAFSASIQVQEGSVPDAALVPVPTKTGYLFRGWKKETGELYDVTQPVQKNMTVTAVWEVITYTIRFDANGGTGTMSEQAHTFSGKKALTANKFKRTGYTFAGWNTQKDGTGTFYKNKEKVSGLTEEMGGTVVFYAMWEGVPYKVKYDGNGATQGSMEDSSHVYGTGSPLTDNGFKRKGYQFIGWNTKKDGSGKSYKNGAEIKNLTTKKNGTIILYAKWKIITYKITYKPGKGKMGKSVRKSYTVNTKTFTLPRPSRKGYDFDGWYRDSALKKRIGTVKQGRTGNLTLYAKWVKCTRKAEADAAKITRCKAVKTEEVNVKATVKKRIASSDDYYYLVCVNPISGKPLRMVSKVYKKKNINFSLNTSENQGYVTSKLGIAVKKDGKYQMISGSSFVKNPEKAAANKTAYQPGKTKKGIQEYHDVSEVQKCDAKQYFMNFTVSAICKDATVPYVYNGKTYYFNSLDYYKYAIRECNANDVTVTVQILLDWTEGHTDLINKRARVPGKLYYSWNIYSTSSREKMEAMFCYLGMIFGQKDCYVSNWILGNEVNHPAGWNYAGSMSTDVYFQTYAYAFRALYYATRSQYANAHVFICTDNYWNTSSSRRFSAKQVIMFFAQHLDAIQKGLQWNLAYHAYSFPLTYTRFWNGYGITNDINTPSVTMKNLQVLTNFIKNNYGSSVRIILSEQGYVSNESETLQAAALAYSYYIAACNPMIDAFIIRSYADDPVEVAQGYRLGIEGKEAFEVFKYMDTAKSTQYTNKYLSVIGGSSWKSLVPGYKEKRLRTMYRKL